jgi:hypothetical protein
MQHMAFIYDQFANRENNVFNDGKRYFPLSWQTGRIYKCHVAFICMLYSYALFVQEQEQDRLNQRI